ncbi:DUF4179 domain-containing protein [Ureibacillus sinduriensis]|uniref:DUF4179 domain-containing protein n=1 Tax=Ureibacillus sinduriensis BLB-1 = JCM 15800 TaxID=1384057 RepID=A0A0A3HUS1_9BACL|nr:DUF4179 domain-containing protein [Ureibacillus sinduriensis]KGR76311.1 hypothetical protein CD33_07135 [Ureibacillus sinduriensis BLB-1 = JCM 15800]
MMCPKEDDLLAYIDGFLDEEETEAMQRHLHSCPYCEQQLEVMESEKTFLEETLKTPVLPEEFAQTVMEQIRPYKAKRNRSWKWGLGTAASVLLAGGILVFVNPSFAEIVGGIFSTDKVDKGLNMAVDTDIATPVDIAVTDAGITLHVEHLIADTSRIAFSYSVTNSHGKRLNPDLEDDQKENVITLLDQDDKAVEWSRSWGNTDDYGIYEFSLVEAENFTAGTIRIVATEIAGKSGNWTIDIPVDLSAAYAKQQVVDIDKSFVESGIEVNLGDISYATSTTDITYHTRYTDEAKQELQAAIKEKVKQFNEEIVDSFFPYHPSIGYRIENEQGEVLGYHNIYAKEDRGHPVTENMIGGSGHWDGESKDMGTMTMTDSFVPEEEKGELYFVLDTVYKTNTPDFSVTFKPEELPYTFDYKGYELTIDSVEREVDYSLQKSWIPIDRQVSVEVSMSGYAEQKAPELAVWAIEDGEGQSYFTFGSGGATLDETDEKGRFKREVNLISYDLKDIPEKMTLHLIAETEAIKLENEWRVPLFQE